MLRKGIKIIKVKLKHFVWYFAQLLILKSDVKHEMYNPCKGWTKNSRIKVLMTKEI